MVERIMPDDEGEVSSSNLIDTMAPKMEQAYAQVEAIKKGVKSPIMLLALVIDAEDPENNGIAQHCVASGRVVDIAMAIHRFFAKEEEVFQAFMGIQLNKMMEKIHAELEDETPPSSVH
jgi:hypothetical protein